MLKSRAPLPETILQIVLFTLFVFSALAYGAVHPWAYTIVYSSSAFFAGGVLLFAGFSALRSSTGDTFGHRCLRAASLMTRGRVLFLLMAFTLLLLFQIAPVPESLLSLLSPNAARLYENARYVTSQNGEALGIGLGHLSVDVDKTIKAALTMLSYIAYAFLVLAASVGKRSRSTRRFVLALTLFSSALALFGLLSFLNEDTGILGANFQLTEAHRISARLINPDHFGTYLLMAIYLIFGYILYHIQRQPTRLGRTALQRFRHALTAEESAIPKVLILTFLMALMTLSLLYTLSRGAVLGLALSMLFCFLLLFLKTRSPLYLLLLLALAGFFAYYIPVVGPELLEKRFEETRRDLQSIDSNARMELYRVGVELWGRYPLLGTGLGSMVVLVPSVRFGSAEHHYVPYIHNDWLQLAIETGWAGLTLFFSLFVIVTWTLLARWWKSKDPRVFGFALAVPCAMIAVAIHSLVDFSLRIPSNAIFLATLVALGWALLSKERGRNDCEEQSTEPGEKRRPLLGAYCSIGCGVAMLCVGFLLIRYYGAERYYPTQVDNIDFSYQSISIVNVKNALRLNSLNSDYWQALGELQSLVDSLKESRKSGEHSAESPEKGSLAGSSYSTETDAAHAAARALRLSPAQFQNWLTLGEHLWKSLKGRKETGSGGVLEEKTALCFEMALELSPTNPHVHERAVPFLLWKWARAIESNGSSEPKREEKEALESLNRSVQLVLNRRPTYRNSYAALLKDLLQTTRIPEAKLGQIIPAGTTLDEILAETRSRNPS